MTLTADEFIRRFLLHALPTGMQRIRYYGLLGNRHRAESLTRCRDLLNMPSKTTTPDESAEPRDYRSRYEALTGRSLHQCQARYANDYSQRAIAALLNERGVPSPGSSSRGRTVRRASGWLGSTINALIPNELYRGPTSLEQNRVAQVSRHRAPDDPRTASRGMDQP
jgi:Putative transposase/Recombinase